MFSGRPRNGNQGTANSSQIPTEATGNVWIRERFIWTVRYLIDNEFYVIIDDHINKDQAGNSMDDTLMKVCTPRDAPTNLHLTHCTVK